MVGNDLNKLRWYRITLDIILIYWTSPVIKLWLCRFFLIRMICLFLVSNQSWYWLRLRYWYGREIYISQITQGSLHMLDMNPTLDCVVFSCIVWNHDVNSSWNNFLPYFDLICFRSTLTIAFRFPLLEIYTQLLYMRRMKKQPCTYISVCILNNEAIKY